MGKLTENSSCQEELTEENEIDEHFFSGEEDISEIPERIANGQENHGELRRSNRTRKPVVLDGYVSYVATEQQDPKTIKEAMSSKDGAKWRDALHDELSSLIENHTWEFVQLPLGKSAIDSKWTFKTKRNAKGDIERCKARLVVKGYTQRYGIDYEETFSPIVRHSSIRLFLSLAVHFKLDIDQMAFLQSELDEEIYMKIPDGITATSSSQVCKLKKSLNGQSK